MKITYVLPRFLALFLILLAIASCNEDFETLGSEIVSDQGLNVLLTDEVSVIAYTKKLPAVQTNGLSKYQVGYYNDPTFGSTTVNLISNLVLNQTDPDFRTSPVIDSVSFYIPYFSSAVSTSDEVTTYTLDSIFGDSPIKLEVFENKFFLRTLDPLQNFEEPQAYFSDQNSLFDDFLGTHFFTLDNFVPSAEEIITLEVNDLEDEEDDEIVRLAPGIYKVFSSSNASNQLVDPVVNFFKETILDNEDNEVLLNNNNFLNFFRGLNFQTSPINGQGSLIGLDLQNAAITIHYSFFEGAETEQKSTDTFVLSFNGVIVNTYDNNFTPDVLSEISNSDPTLGDDNIYIKGGEGSIGIIELFGKQDVLGYVDGELINEPNGVPDELDEIRKNDWFINEANLIFYINQDLVQGGETEPERILLYDIENSRALADYNLDPTQSVTPVIQAYTNHLGPIQRGADNAGEFYKIRITNYISNLVKRDSINRQLGLVVIQQPTSIGLQGVRPLDQTIGSLPQIQDPLMIENLPEATIETLEGTVLYGNTTPNEEKRLRLQIYYTDPNQ